MSCRCSGAMQTPAERASAANFIYTVLVVTALIVADAAMYFTLSYNLSSRVYPVAADSIGIPVTEGVIASLGLLALLLVAIFVPRNAAWCSILSVACAGLAGLVAAALALYWAVPHHYPISFAYGGVVLASVFVAARCARSLFQSLAAKGGAPASALPDS